MRYSAATAESRLGSCVQALFEVIVALESDWVEEREIVELCFCIVVL